MRNWVIPVMAAQFLIGFGAQRTSALESQATAGETYYYGAVNFFSPDGKIPTGKTVSLAKRIINKTGTQIIEIILQPSRKTGQEPKEIVTIMDRITGTKTFAATDEERTFSGSIAFDDDSLARWTYNIKLNDGSKIAGEGSTDAEGLKTRKLFSNPQDAAVVLIKEDLKIISADEYLKRRRELNGK